MVNPSVPGIKLAQNNSGYKESLSNIHHPTSVYSVPISFSSAYGRTIDFQELMVFFVKSIILLLIPINSKYLIIQPWVTLSETFWKPIHDTHKRYFLL